MSLTTPSSYQKSELEPGVYGERIQGSMNVNNNTNLNDDNNQNNNNGEEDDTASIQSDSNRPYFYNWRMFAPATGRCWHYVRWLVVGGGLLSEPQSDESLHNSLSGLARCLILMRKYLDSFGMPTKGGVRDQEYVLREITRDLYAGGAPLWALEPVMQKAAEGLTGQPNVNWLLFPRKAFAYSPTAATTTMFKMERGFHIRKMDRMERVAVRLASFASNVQGFSNIPTRFPDPREFNKVARTESVRNFARTEQAPVLARKILHLASKHQGLFYYINSGAYQGRKDSDHDLDTVNEDDVIEENVIDSIPLRETRPSPVKDFWVVTEDERELFSRLACQEAMRHIRDIDKLEAQEKTNPWLIVAYRVMASAGACAFWFRGSWYDMIVAGILAVIVAFIGTSKILSRQERIVYEVVASFFVGLVASLIALQWPNHTCFTAMAIAGVLDILQGFRVVYAVIELMSKHTVAGSADLLEGILYTGLIAYFLRFGQFLGSELLKHGKQAETFTPCTNGINELWYILFVPLAALSWSGLFTPKLADLPLMGFHGILAFAVNYLISKAGGSIDLNNFVAACIVTSSAGLISRFTGRQAVGNAVAGMYVLLPGAYLVKSLYSTKINGSFFFDVISQAIVIGIGGWTGTILVSPTLLGTTKGLLGQQQGYHHSRPSGEDTQGGHHRRHDSSLPGNDDTALTMLFF